MLSMGLLCFTHLLTWTICSITLQQINAQQNMDMETPQRLLEEALMEVVRQHSYASPYFDTGEQPPDFQMPDSFMHSYLPNSGVGNREDLRIQTVRKVPMFDDSSFSQWRYRRFNHTDYIMGISGNKVTLWRKNVMDDSPMDFSASEGILNYTPENEGVVADAIMFNLFVKSSDVLYVAILTEYKSSSFINIFEIVDNLGLMSTGVHLRRNPAPNLKQVPKLAHVASRQGFSLVVLISDVQKPEIIYQQKGSNVLNHYIEVRYPSAVDVVSFSIAGYGYVAVANSSTFEVYKMNAFVKSHRVFDRGDFLNIVDLEYFRLGFHHYLAVVGENRQILYAWKNGGFFEKQAISVHGTKQISSVLLPNCRDDVLLLFVKDSDTEIWIWNGRKEIFSAIDYNLPKDFTPQSGSITSYSHRSTVYVLFVDRMKETQVFAVDTELTPITDPVLGIGKAIADSMKELQVKIVEQENMIKEITTILDNAVKPSGDQDITAYQTFNYIETSGEVQAPLDQSHIAVQWENSGLTLPEYLAGTQQLEVAINELDESIKQLEALLPDVVRVDESATISGHKVFTGKIKAASVIAQSLNVRTIAGIDVPELLKQIYRLDRPELIRGAITFEEPLAITGDLDVEGTINGIKFEQDIMTTDTYQVSEAEMTFGKLNVKENINLSGRLNGIDIGNEVVTLSGTHTITGYKQFLNGIIAENALVKYIDGVDINNLYNKALTSSGNQTITGTKQFTGTVHAQDITVHGKINGYNLLELVESIVRTDVPASIGHVTFLDDVNIKNTLTVGGTVNNLKIPDDLFLPGRSQVITGSKTFSGSVVAEDVTVTGTIDGIKIPDDIITLSKDEIIEDDISFMNGISVSADVIVGGLVDGVDISKLAEDALKLNETNEIKNAVFLGPVTILGDIDVQGTVNGIMLKDILSDIVFKDETSVVFTGEKHFTHVVAGKVVLQQTLNGLNIKKDFMFVHGNQTIHGTKIFTQPVTFQDLTTPSDVIDGVNLTQLYHNRITLSAEQSIQSDIEFLDHLIINGNLIVHGTIDGLRFPGDVVVKSVEQSLSSKTFSGSIHIQNLVVNGSVSVRDTFGGIKLPDFLDEIINLSDDQIIPGDILLGNTSASKVEITGLINGIDIVKFASNVMSLTKDQTVTGFKEFSGLTKIYGSLQTTNGINGVNLANVKEKAFKIHGDNIITEPFIFNEPVTLQDATVDGLINGVNITHLDLDSVKTTGFHYVQGTATFLNGFHVEGDINADSVNGMHLPTDILTKNTPQTITGSYTFQDLIVNGNVMIDKHLNGIDLSEVAPLLAQANKENTIQSNVVFKRPVTVTGDIHVTGLVNNVDLKTLEKTALLTTGDQFVAGHKIIKGKVFVHGDMNVTNVNGENWREFVSDVVRTDISQFITAPKVFLNDLEVRGDVYVEGFAKVDFVNGINLTKFMDEAVFLDSPANITGQKIFTGTVEIIGDLNAELINGLRLEKDIITLQCSNKEPQVITGQKTFQKFNVLSDIIVEGLVNGYKLKDLMADTLMTDGDQIITGHKKFHQPVIFKKDVFPTTVNDIVLSQELVTLHTDQEITGRLTFKDGVHVIKDLTITGLLNEVDINKLANDALYIDTDQTISGVYDINEAAVKGDIFVGGTVNGIDLDMFDQNVTEFWKNTKVIQSSLINETGDQCQIAKDLHTLLEHSYYVLDGFMLHQNLNTPADLIQLGSFNQFNLVQYPESGSSARSFKYHWKASDGKFDLMERSNTNTYRSLLFDLGGKNLFVHLAVNSEESVVLFDGLPMHSIFKSFNDAAAIVKNKAILLALLYSSRNSCYIYKIRYKNSMPAVENLGFLQIEGATALVFFEISKILHLAIASDFSPQYSRGSSKLFALRNKEWHLVQNIPASASSYVMYFQYHAYHYLAFTNAVPVYEAKEPKAVQVYRSTAQRDVTFTLLQKIPFDNAAGLSTFEFGGLSELYLTIFNETRVQVFLLEGEAGFRSNFTIHGKCIKDVKPLLIEKELFLTVAQRNDDVLDSSTVVYKGLTQGSTVPHTEFKYCP